MVNPARGVGVDIPAVDDLVRALPKSRRNDGSNSASQNILRLIPQGFGFAGIGGLGIVDFLIPCRQLVAPKSTLYRVSLCTWRKFFKSIFRGPITIWGLSED